MLKRYEACLQCSEDNLSPGKKNVAVWILETTMQFDDPTLPSGTRLVRPIRDGLRAGSQELLIWLSYAERTALAWNLLALALKVTGLPRRTPVDIVAAALESKGSIDLPRELRWHFGYLTAKEYNVPNAAPVSWDLPEDIGSDGASLFV